MARCVPTDSHCSSYQPSDDKGKPSRLTFRGIIAHTTPPEYRFNYSIFSNRVVSDFSVVLGVFKPSEHDTIVRLSIRFRVHLVHPILLLTLPQTLITLLHSFQPSCFTSLNSFGGFQPVRKRSWCPLVDTCLRSSGASNLPPPSLSNSIWPTTFFPAASYRVSRWYCGFLIPLSMLTPFICERVAVFSRYVPCPSSPFPKHCSTPPRFFQPHLPGHLSSSWVFRTLRARSHCSFVNTCPGSPGMSHSSAPPPPNLVELSSFFLTV